MMLFCGEFGFPAFQNFQMWVFKEFGPTVLQLELETDASVPVGVLTCALFLCFDSRTDVTGLLQYPSFECSVLPVLLL